MEFRGADAEVYRGEGISDPVFRPRGEAILRLLVDEWFLVPIRSSPVDFREIFNLNRVGAYIWEQLDGERPLGAVVDRVVERFDVSPETASADAAAFVEQLTKAGLVERTR